MLSTRDISHDTVKAISWLLGYDPDDVTMIRVEPLEVRAFLKSAADHHPVVHYVAREG
jgi:hypothetical protein